MIVVAAMPWYVWVPIIAPFVVLVVAMLREMVR